MGRAGGASNSCPSRAVIRTAIYDDAGFESSGGAATVWTSISPRASLQERDHLLLNRQANTPAGRRGDSTRSRSPQGDPQLSAKMTNRPGTAILTPARRKPIRSTAAAFETSATSGPRRGARVKILFKASQRRATSSAASPGGRATSQVYSGRNKTFFRRFEGLSAQGRLPTRSVGDANRWR